MSDYVEINNHIYYKPVLASEKKYRYHESQRAKHQARLENASSEKERAAIAQQGGYGAWMHGRRMGEYRDQVWEQEFNIHSIAVVLEGKVVCSCGLVADGDELSDSYLFSDGHIYTPTRKLVTSFTCFANTADDSEANYFCQICGAKTPAEIDADGNPTLEGLHSFESQHSCRT
jgi:hypothetical protein